MLYNIEAQLGSSYSSGSGRRRNVQTLALNVMKRQRLGRGPKRAQAAALQTKWWAGDFGSSKGFASLDAFAGSGITSHSFDSVPALRSVTCPVLGLFRALDTSTPAARAARNMELALRAAGNQDVTIPILNEGTSALGGSHRGELRDPRSRSHGSWPVRHTSSVAVEPNHREQVGRERSIR